MSQPTDAMQPVREMYERHPYPSPLAEGSLIHDLANAVAFLSPADKLSGKSVLDAGCGTGHRLIALARAFPEAKFVGTDMTTASLRTAAALGAHHGVTNVTFVQQDLLQPLPDRYDAIVSTGVIHHLTNPEAGVRNLCAALRDEGFLFLWIYHPYGEFRRLLERDLALLLWPRFGRGPDAGVDFLRRLRVSLSPEQYGTNSSRQALSELSQESIDIDAYLHPIVNAYTFDQMFAMLSRCGVDWMAPNGLNYERSSKLIDLGKRHKDPYFTADVAELFPDVEIREAYERLMPMEKLRAIELALRPSGITVLAGRGQAYRTLESRIEGNLMALGDAGGHGGHW